MTASAPLDAERGRGRAAAASSFARPLLEPRAPAWIATARSAPPRPRSAPWGARPLVPCGPGTRPDGGSPPTSRPRATQLRDSREWASIASMALPYQPKPGTLWMCDFSGFRRPEMIKKRPVVVVSPRPKNHVGLCTVVPLSTLAPTPVKAFHYLMAARSLRAELGAQKNSWAKCDMVCTVSLERLARVSGSQGTLRVSDADLAAIRRCVGVALGLDAAGGAGA